MTDKFFNALGLCRRAGKLSVGHDEVKAAVKSGKAKLLLLTSDASDRLKEELLNLGENIPARITDSTIEENKFRIGKGAAALAVTDDGLAKLIIKEINDTEIGGT